MAKVELRFRGVSSQGSCLHIACPDVLKRQHTNAALISDYFERSRIVPQMGDADQPRSAEDGLPIRQYQLDGEHEWLEDL